MAKESFVGTTRTITPVEYIESDGFQWIDTGIETSLNITIQTEIAYNSATSVASWNGAVYTNSLGWIAFGDYGTGTLASYFCYGTRNGATITKDTDYHTYYVSNGLQKVDTVETYITASTMSTGLTLWLFNGHNNWGNNTMFASEKLKYCKIWDNGVLVRDFIPVLIDAEYGLYDQVENKLYYNQGTGTFTGGSTTGDSFTMDIARKIKTAYVGINGVARRIKKGYVGVNGVAKLCTNFYKEIDYLESSGGQYIDSGIVPNSNTRIVCTYANTTLLNGVQTGDEYSTSYSYRWGFNASGYLMISYAGTSTQSATKYEVCKKYTFDIKNGTQTVSDENGNVLLTTSRTMSTYSSYSIPLFANWRGSSMQATFPDLRIYSFKIYNGNTLVRDFIPVLDENGVACMYDNVTEDYFYNAGTGSFVPSENDLFKAYNYIENSGTQFIDTGFKHNNNTRVNATFETTYAQDSVYLYPYGSFGGSALADKKFFCVQVPNNNRNIQTIYDGSTYTYTSSLITGVHKIDMNKNVHTVDGSAHTFTSQTFQSISNFGFFGIGSYAGNVEVQDRIYFRLHRTKMWDNGTMIRDFIPVIRKSDSQPCLYDLINSEFYTNQGTGTFLYG